MADRLDEMLRRADAFAQYHAKHEGYGGASRDFHAMALTFLREDVPDLVAEVERLRAETAAKHEALCEQSIQLGVADAEVAQLRAKVESQRAQRVELDAIIAELVGDIPKEDGTGRSVNARATVEMLRQDRDDALAEAEGLRGALMVAQQELSQRKTGH